MSAATEGPLTSQHEQTLQFDMQPLPPGVPWRFNGNVFPHALVASRQKDGTHVNLLDTSRMTNLTFKLNSLPVDLAEELKTYPLALHLSLEISDASGWRRAVANGDFPGDKSSIGEASHPGCARLRIKSSRVLSAYAVCRSREPTRDGPLVWQEM